MVTGDVADLSTEIDARIPFEVHFFVTVLQFIDLIVLNSFENTFNLCSKL